MPTYKNANTGDVVSFPSVNHRLEGLRNWERIEEPQPEVAPDPPEAPAALRAQLAEATVAQLRELAEERGFDVGDAERKADLVEAIAAAIEAEAAD